MPSRTSTFAILLEAVMVAAAAAAFAFAANGLSPRGLKLARDYFPAGASPSNAPPATASVASTNQNPAATELDQRIKQKGLQPIDRAQAERLFRDPRYLQGLIVFVDARDKDHYADGHIPGAVPLDRYHPEKDLSATLTACQNADMVVVYCTGGDCDDSDYTALLLRDAGIPIQKLFVYGTGFDDWSAARLPVEQGAHDEHK